MKSILVNLPDNLASATKDYVNAGFFQSEADVIIAAIAAFIRRNKINLTEKFALEDIEWAKKEAQKVI